MVLHVDREASVGGVEARTLRDRPALQDSVELQPEIVVQPSSRVFLNDEAIARAAADLRPRLRRPVEPPLALVFRELPGLVGSGVCPRR